MVEYVTGDLFTAKAQVLVNPVNCVGVMGKGLALEFKRRFPWIMFEYERICRERRLQPGMVWQLWPPTNSVYDECDPSVLLFATKGHWKCASQLEWIRKGLAEISALFWTESIKSLAMPWVGCGLGGLDKKDVKPAIDEWLGVPPFVRAQVYSPEGA